MKKWFISLLLIAASLVLSACSKSTESGYPMVEPTQQDAFASTAMSTEQPTEVQTEALTEAPTEAPTPTPAPTETPTPEPTLRPEITELPEAVNVNELTPVITIPLVYDTVYDPWNDYKSIVKVNFYADDDDSPIISGPSSYTVVENELLVLDAFAQLLRVYDLNSGEWLKNIDAAAAGFEPLTAEGSVAYWNGYYWIRCYHKGFVIAVNDEGSVWKTIPVPDAGNIEDYEYANDYLTAKMSIKRAPLQVIDGELYLKCHGCTAENMPDFKLEGDEFVPCEPRIKCTITDYPDWTYVITNGEYTWYIPTDADLAFECNVLEVDEYGNLYASCSLLTVDSNGHPHSDQSLRIYDKDSRLVGIFRYEMAEPIDYGTHIVAKDTEGVWIMCCTEDEVRICVLPFESR